MAFNLKRFETFMSKGLSLFTPDFNGDLTMNSDSYNMIQGIRQGMSPRFGFSPIPGHDMVDASLVTVPPTPSGLLASEAAAGYLATKRRRFIGVVPITFASQEDPAVTHTYFAWLNAFKNASDTDVYVDVSVGSANLGTYGGGAFRSVKHSSDIAAGITPAKFSDFGAPIALNYYFQLNPVSSKYLYINKYYARFASMVVSGKDVPQKYVAGFMITAPTATRIGAPTLLRGLGDNQHLGTPSGFNTRTFKKSTRDLTFHVMAASANAGNPMGLNKSYYYKSVVVNNSVFVAAYNQDTTVAQIVLSVDADSTSARLDGAGVNFSTSDYLLMVDGENVTNSSYNAILAATGNHPLCWIFQDWNRNIDGTLNQMVSLTTYTVYPYDSAQYYEGKTAKDKASVINKVLKPTCWANWPTYAEGALDDTFAGHLYALKAIDPSTDPLSQVQYCENNSGVLRGGQTYEFTFSIYNKRLNFETNVGTPAKLLIPSGRTGAADDLDYVAITLFRNLKAADAGPVEGVSLQRHNAASSGYSPLIPFGSSGNIPGSAMNDIEYRVYYRPLGTFEWLPAGSIDAAQYWFDPTLQYWRVCTGTDSSGLPGGQPGGFNDYSNLPDDSYVDVLSWRGRAFWLSAKNLIFSNLNNIFSYPLRNSVACPNGSYRGMLVHAYPGQAQQQGRIIVFGSEENYIGRFTGEPTMYPVQVSANTVGTFPLDGSDFVLERWTSITSFSARTAVIAEGDLYFWGPKGIYRDNGTEFPDKISYDLEPDIFRIYDPNATDEMFGHYFPESKEIWWVYNPVDTTITVSYALVFNTMTGQFQYCRFTSKVDTIQDLNIEGTVVTRKTAGPRHVASVRKDDTQTISRAYFFDIVNRQGDLSPGSSFCCSAINTTIAPGFARLTLNGGFDVSMLSTVQIGDQVLMGQYQAYTARTDWADFVGTVSAVQAVVPYYIDVRLPTALGTPAVNFTLTSDKYAPIWISRCNSFPYLFRGNYWTPAGMSWWGNWLFLHHQYKIVSLITTNTPPTISLGARTPISKQVLSRTVTLVDNSDGNCQVYSQIFGADQGFEGQGIKLSWSGTYLGHDWILQYVAADTQPMEGDQLQIFEG